MESEDFLQLLYHSKGLVGNSSVGIRECAFLGVPVINIGSRQHRRQQGGNVLDVPHDKEAIKNAIETHFQHGRPVSSAIYGTGEAGKSIAALLSSLPLRFHKTIVY